MKLQSGEAEKCLLKDVLLFSLQKTVEANSSILTGVFSIFVLENFLNIDGNPEYLKCLQVEGETCFKLAKRKQDELKDSDDVGKW